MGDRKARLAALAAKAGRSKPTHSEEDETNEAETKKSISFRNYAPKDASMEQAEEEEEGSATKRMRTEDTKTSGLQEALQAAQSEIASGAATATAKDQTSTGVTSMAPKKVNWDLKRDVEKKLAKLERRTQRAIVELLKERLEREANEQARGDDSSDLD